jgi:hypothetical protein
MGARRGRSLRALLAGSLVVGVVVVGSVVVDSVPASASTPVSLYVAVGGAGDCTIPANACGSIHTAINTAQGGAYNGDNVTINVAAGTYTENDSISASSLNSLTLAGAGASTTTVNGNQAGSVLTVSNGSVTISGLTIENGSTRNGTGGGIFNGGTLTVTDSTIRDNDALGGGGIESVEGMLTVSDSTISGNGGQAGGGIESVEGTLTVSDSTFWGNTAINGGGIESLSSSLTITDSTLSGNDATTNGGGIFTELGNDNLGATIVAGNAGSNCYDGTGGIMTSVGYNLTDDATGANCGFTRPTDVANAHPQLGPLTDNGGPTETILPALGSPAIGVIPSSPATILNGAQVCSRTDERGVASFGSCTIGAVEGGFLISTTSLPNATPGTAYGVVTPVTLTTQEAGISTSPYATTLKWKKVTLPKGLKLSSAGVLSGTPSKNLPAGASSITVKVTETVTTLSSKNKKVKTPTTVQATIPLTIT